MRCGYISCMSALDECTHMRALVHVHTTCTLGFNYCTIRKRRHAKKTSSWYVYETMMNVYEFVEQREAVKQQLGVDKLPSYFAFPVES